MPAFVRDWAVRSGVLQTAAAISGGELPLEVEGQLLDALRGSALPDEALVARMAASLAPHVGLSSLGEAATAEVLKGAIAMLSMRTGLLQGLVGGTVKVDVGERSAAAAVVEELQEDVAGEALAKRLSRKVELPLAIVRAIVGSLGELLPREVPAGALDFAFSEGRAAEAEEHLVERVVDCLGGKFVSPEETRPVVLLTVRGWLGYVNRRLQREGDLVHESRERSRPWIVRQVRRLGGASLGGRLRDRVSGGVRGALRGPAAAVRELVGGGGGGRGAGGGRGSGSGPPGGEPPEGTPPAGSSASGAEGPRLPRWARPALAGLVAAVALVAAGLALARRRARQKPSEDPSERRPFAEVARSDLYIGISAAALVEVLRLLLLRWGLAARLRRLLGIDDGLPEGDPESWDVYPEVLLSTVTGGGTGGSLHDSLRERPALVLGLLFLFLAAAAAWRRRHGCRASGFRQPAETTPFEFLADLRPWLLTSGLPHETAKTLAATALFAHSLVSQIALSSGRMSRSCALVVSEPESLARVAAIQQEASSTITRYDVPRLTIWQLCDWKRLQDCLVHDGDCLLLRPNGSLHAVMQQTGKQTPEMWKECSVRAGATAVLLDAPDSHLGASVAVLGGATVWQSGRVVPVVAAAQGPGQRRPSAHMMVAAALHSVDEFVVGRQ